MTMLVTGAIRKMGTDPRHAVLRFGPDAEPTRSGPGGARLLFVDDRPAFELSFWCGSCPALFERKADATRTLSMANHAAPLAVGLEDLDDSVIGSFAELLPFGRYQPMLLEIEPRLVRPLDSNDYFAHEQVATWGVDPVLGSPENPHTSYYRTFDSAVSADDHFYEFVVPMVPPDWNDVARVEQFRRQLQTTSAPTAVAVSILDVCQPAVADQSSDYYTHWVLMHFLLDGHHKTEAAAKDRRPVRLLSLLSVDAGLAGEQEIGLLPGIRAGLRGGRARVGGGSASGE